MLMDYWAQLSQEHIEPSDHSAVKRLMIFIKVRGARIESGLTVYTTYCCWYFHCLFE